jgi:hypothetical protein
VRLVRIILEGMLVAAVAALVFYPLRHHPVAGLVLVIVVCLLGIALISIIEKRLAQRKDAQANQMSATVPALVEPTNPVDLTITADGVQIHVTNNGPLADFTAEIAGINISGTESPKHGTLRWARPDEENLSIGIPLGATRTIPLWTVEDGVVSLIPSHPMLKRNLVHLLAWSDGMIPVGPNQSIRVRLRIVRADPPGFTDRIVTIGNHTSGDSQRFQQSWYSEVEKIETAVVTSL